MEDERRSAPGSLLVAARPDLETAPLVVSSDLLVLMLRFASTLRSLLLLPAIQSAPEAAQIHATVLDMERSAASLLRAVDELTESR